MKDVYVSYCLQHQLDKSVSVAKQEFDEWLDTESPRIHAEYRKLLGEMIWHRYWAGRELDVTPVILKSMTITQISQAVVDKYRAQCKPDNTGIVVAQWH